MVSMVDFGVIELILLLEAHEHSAYIVGGAVRDITMNKKPKDWDVCTSALPSQVIEICSQYEYTVVETGLQHGTVTVIDDGDGASFEVTTYRIDGGSTDSRHPDKVTFVDNIEEDLARRDFTINALAMGRRGNIVDPFQGVHDIDSKIIRCVGNPCARFEEDALRILRALRFASELGFEIEEATSKEIFRQAHLLKNISQERISSEFVRILTGRNAVYVLNYYKDVIACFIPEIVPMFSCNQSNNYHPYDVWIHTLCALDHVPHADMIARLGIFFHDIGKPSVRTIGVDGIGHFYGHEKVSADLTREILLRLRFSKSLIDAVTLLVLHHNVPVEPTPKSVKRLLRKIGLRNFAHFSNIRYGDVLGQSYVFSFDRIKKLNKIKDIVRKIDIENQCFKTKDLNINGRDVMALGVSEGRLVGEVLNQLLNAVIDEEVKNESQALIHKAREIIESINTI